MAKFRPKTLKEIQKKFGRPASLEYAEPNAVREYYGKLVKLSNDRIRKLESKGINSYAVQNLRAELELPDALTKKGYVKKFKSGDLRRYRGAIKALEKFIASKGSTITGLREMAEKAFEDYEESFDLTPQEASDWVKATLESGLSQQVIYQIESMIGEVVEDYPTLDLNSEEAENEVIRLIDNHIIAVDDDIEPIVLNILNRYRETGKSSMLEYWEKTGRRR